MPSGRIREDTENSLESPAEAVVQSSGTVPPLGSLATAMAIALAVGISAGWHQNNPRVWPWLIACGVCGGISVIAAFRALRLSIICLMLSFAALGAGWVTLHQHMASARDLEAYIGDQAVLVRVRGTAEGPPTLRARTSGSMARFDYREPATYFPMRVNALLDRHGHEHDYRGKLLVRVDATVAPFRAGDPLDAIGFVTLPPHPRNPGEFNFRQYARSLGQAGILNVPQRELLTIRPIESLSLYERFLDWRDRLRKRSSAWLLSDLPETGRTQRDLLLTNLLLGEREEQIDGFSDSFQRVGLAHVLAISGFHLSVLAGFILLAARMLNGHQRWHGWLVIGVVLVYLTIVEVRMPVMRAGVMTIAASIALIFGRRLQVGGLIALSAILLLLARPDQLFNAGFQLTFAVVLALVHLAAPLRNAWFGPANPEAATTSEMFGEWLKTTVAASTAAWLIATPIGMYHFGMVATFGIIASIIAVPLSAVILAIGYLKMLLSALLPSVAMLVGIPLSIGADVLVSIVTAIDAIPLAALYVPYPSTVWSLLAIGLVCWWALPRPRANTSVPAAGVRTAKCAALAALLVWLLWPMWQQAAAHSPLRIDMLAVGDGSCYVVRQGGSAVLFDAGSSTDLNVGRRSLIPALRRLGLRSIDAIAISHADIDHYSAVLELADEFAVKEVLVTPEFLAEAREGPLGPVATLVEGLTQRRIVVRPVTQGEQRQWGQARWRWLHPPADQTFELANEGSMVIRIEYAGRAVLFCGDIQEQGMQALSNSAEDLKAEVIELPHHGSYNETAARFLTYLDAQVIMQSTGWGRWIRDRWGDQLNAAKRLVTVRDGACWVEIRNDGEISTGKYIHESGLTANSADSTG